MVAKEISVKKYVVRLNADEREQLEALIRKGKSPAQRLLKARILLKADVSEAGEGWSDVIAHPRGWLVQAGRGIGFPWRVRRMASMARIERRRRFRRRSECRRR